MYYAYFEGLLAFPPISLCCLLVFFAAETILFVYVGFPVINATVFLVLQLSFLLLNRNVLIEN